ncbi:unnamed protein product [Penicillium manginii]
MYTWLYTSNLMIFINAEERKLNKITLDHITTSTSSPSISNRIANGSSSTSRRTVDGIANTSRRSTRDSSYSTGHAANCVSKGGCHPFGSACCALVLGADCHGGKLKLVFLGRVGIS